MADLSFHAAVAAIHAGDVVALSHLLDAEPRLLRARLQDDALDARFAYFRNPKLFWFVANNPILVEPMPANMAELARAMLDRGVERVDLDTTLGLVMTGRSAREAGLQRPLMRLLIDEGASVSREAVIAAAGHREHDAIRALREDGFGWELFFSATLGDDERFPVLAASASRSDRQTAFGLAVINDNASAALEAIAAGADVNAPLPAHAHSTALHQAALNENVALVEALLAAGADPNRRDAIWNGTPLDWVIHENRLAARRVLEAAAQRYA